MLGIEGWILTNDLRLSIDPLCISVFTLDPIATNSGRGDIPRLLRCVDLRFPTNGALRLSYPDIK